MRMLEGLCGMFWREEREKCYHVVILHYIKCYYNLKKSLNIVVILCVYVCVCTQEHVHAMMCIQKSDNMFVLSLPHFPKLL